MVYSTDRSKAVIPVLVLLFGALVLPCAILFLCFFSPFSNAITSLGDERANLNAFRIFDRFVLVWICQFPLPLDVWEGLQFVIVALPGLFIYLFWLYLPLNFGFLKGANMEIFAGWIKFRGNGFPPCA